MPAVLAQTQQPVPMRAGCYSRPALHIGSTPAVRLTRVGLGRSPLLSDTLEAFGPYRRRGYQRTRVAEIQRPVKGFDASDLEVAGDAVLAVAAAELDIAHVVSSEIKKQQLEQQFAAASSRGSRQQTGQQHDSSDDRAAAGISDDANAALPVVPSAAISSSSSSSAEERTAGEASTSGREPYAHALVAGGGCTAASDTPAVLIKRAPLSGFQPTPSDEPGGAAAAAAELEPLLQQPHDASAAAAAFGASPVAGVPRSVLILSLVSMALTSASCVFNTLLPIYMVTELRMSMRSMGMFEGFLEAFSYVVRMFSGVISDRLTSRKAAITLGFAMGAAAKTGMSFAADVASLFVAKAVDRLANGVQAAPRDALIGDLSPSATRSACFGFAQSMRKWGSFMGAGLAFALMKLSGNNYHAIFLGAAAASALACVAFVIFVPAHPLPGGGAAAAAKAAAAAPGAAPSERPTSGAAATLARLAADVGSMGRDFWRVLSVIALYGLGHINESMLEARAIEVGFGKAEATLVVALLCFSVFLCAYPLGRLDDSAGHNVTFAVGMASLVAGDLILLTSGAWPGAVFAACLFWGAHWAVVQGPMLSIVVGLAPSHLKGTAFGIFYTVMALTAMAANSMYGALWTHSGANAAFGLSALIITLTLAALPSLLPPSRRQQQQQQQQQQQGSVAAAPA